VRRWARVSRGGPERPYWGTASERRPAPTSIAMSQNQQLGSGVYPGCRGAGRLAQSLGSAALVALLAACVTTPITGRRSLNFYAVEEEVPLGAEAYEQLLSEESLITSGPEFDMVQRISARLVEAAAPEDPGYAWETRLIRAPTTANAFCLPGGKMAVYSGLIPIAQNEAALAAVMGHEIGHALARHGTERLTQSQALGVVTEVVNTTVEGASDYTALGGALIEYGVFLPWGRRQELEADRLGLVLMARAGYDPREAVGLWERMSALSGGSNTPSWLSTHPSGEDRIAEIQALLPEVLPIYEASQGR